MFVGVHAGRPREENARLLFSAGQRFSSISAFRIAEEEEKTERQGGEEENGERKLAKGEPGIEEKN